MNDEPDSLVAPIGALNMKKVVLFFNQLTGLISQIVAPPFKAAIFARTVRHVL